MASRDAAPGRDGRRRGVPGAAAAVVLLAVALGAWGLLTDATVEPVASPRATASARAPSVAATPDGIPGRARRNADGSLSVAVSERETAALVRAGLRRTSAPMIEDLRVDLVEATGGAAATMVLDGRLADQGLPVRATVDLAVLDGRVRPTIRDLRVGPLPVSGGARDDLNRELAERGALLGAGLVVEDVRSTGERLLLRGRRR